MALSKKAPGAASALVVPEPADIVEPIVVPNTFWTSGSPGAYVGGHEPDHTHLAQLEADEASRRDNARWSGPLEFIRIRSRT